LTHNIKKKIFKKIRPENKLKFFFLKWVDLYQNVQNKILRNFHNECRSPRSLQKKLFEKELFLKNVIVFLIFFKTVGNKGKKSIIQMFLI